MEKETLQRVIDEARATIDSVNADRLMIEDFKELKKEMDKYHLQSQEISECTTSIKEIQV